MKLKRFPQMQLKCSFSQICESIRQESAQDASGSALHDALGGRGRGGVETLGNSEFSQLTDHMAFISISCGTEMHCEEG